MRSFFYFIFLEIRVHIYIYIRQLGSHGISRGALPDSHLFETFYGH